MNVADSGHFLSARFNVSLPGVERTVARDLIDEAHRTCPYSKATRGNIEVAIRLMRIAASRSLQELAPESAETATPLSRRYPTMNSKLLTATVLVIAIGASLAGFVRNVGMPQTSSGFLDLLFQRSHASSVGDKADLASLGRADRMAELAAARTGGLRGKVVLIDFWTYTCINWLRTAPYVRAWAEKYKDQGLVVIGVHAPEFAFEKNIDNVRRAVRDFRIGHPVAVDNEHAIWRAFKNQYWPALYFIDAQGRLRHHHFGEGSYEQSEKIIQDLLAEAGATASTASPCRLMHAASRPRPTGPT